MCNGETRQFIIKYALTHGIVSTDYSKYVRCMIWNAINKRSGCKSSSARKRMPKNNKTPSKRTEHRKWTHKIHMHILMHGLVGSFPPNPHDYKRYTIVMCQHHRHCASHREHPTSHRLMHSLERCREQRIIRCSLLLVARCGAASASVARFVSFFVLSLKNDFSGSSRHIAQNNNNICICIHICILYWSEQRQLRFISETEL